MEPLPIIKTRILEVLVSMRGRTVTTLFHEPELLAGWRQKVGRSIRHMRRALRQNVKNQATASEQLNPCD